MEFITELLTFCPHGLLIGCGGTSEYLTYVFRHQLTDLDLIFQKLNRQGEHYDFEFDGREFTLSEIDSAVEEIRTRLELSGYVRVSFTAESDFNQPVELPTAVKASLNGSLEPILFDHSFVLLKQEGVWRLESYLGQSPPRQVKWDEYEQDLKLLATDPLQAWEKIFEVACKLNCDLETVKINVET